MTPVTRTSFEQSIAVAMSAAGTLYARVLLFMTIFLALTVSAAMAQSRPNGSETPAQLRERHADYLQQCLREWDAATHMTKQDWARTCRRVVDERVKYLLDRSKQDKGSRLPGRWRSLACSPVGLRVGSKSASHYACPRLVRHPMPDVPGSYAL